MTEALCPCCGAALAPGQIVVDLLSGIITTERGKSRCLWTRVAMVVEILARCRQVRTAQMINYLWVPDGEPEDAQACLHSLVSRARKALVPLGYSIINMRDVGYALIEIPASPSLSDSTAMRAQGEIS